MENTCLKIKITRDMSERCWMCVGSLKKFISISQTNWRLKKGNNFELDFFVCSELQNSYLAQEFKALKKYNVLVTTTCRKVGYIQIFFSHKYQENMNE